MLQIGNVQEVLSALGPRLRALRTERKASLAWLATTTGISTSTLSRLETGRLRPTLEQVLPLASAYGMTIDELVRTPEPTDPRVTMRATTRHGTTYMPLSQRSGGLQAYKIVIPVRRRRSTDRRSHEGYEWLYVLSGSALLALGEREFVLAPGEAAEFDTHVPHLIGNAGDLPVELLVLFGQQGERAHLAVRAGRPAGTSGARRRPGGRLVPTAD